MWWWLVSVYIYLNVALSVVTPVSGMLDQKVIERDFMQPAKPVAKCDPSSCSDRTVFVCGSDGVTYDNKCILEYVNCKNHERGLPQIELVAEKQCDEKPYSQLPVVISPQVAALEEASMYCDRNIVCDPIQDFVCGSDGKTYDNACLWRKQACQQHDLRIAHLGECEHTTSSSGSFTGEADAKQ